MEKISIKLFDNAEGKMEETISLKELFLVLKKRLGLIFIITFITVLTSGIVSFFVLTPMYQTSTQLLVNQAKGQETSYSSSELQTNLYLIETYNVIIKCPAILDIVRDELDFNLSTPQLNGKISVASVSESQVVNITVQDASLENAVAIANKTAEVFQREIINIMNVDNVTILSPAIEQGHYAPISPNPFMNIMIALVIGLMVGVGLAFLQEYLDNTVKSEQDIERIIGAPILGVVAVMDIQQKKSDEPFNMKMERLIAEQK